MSEHPAAQRPYLTGPTTHNVRLAMRILQESSPATPSGCLTHALGYLQPRLFTSLQATISPRYRRASGVEVTQERLPERSLPTEIFSRRGMTYAVATSNGPVSAHQAAGKAVKALIQHLHGEAGATRSQDSWGRLRGGCRSRKSHAKHQSASTSCTCPLATPVCQEAMAEVGVFDAGGV